MSRNNKIKTIRELKLKSGSHSPSLVEIQNALGYNPIKHDFCFLSNPYATDIVVEYFEDKLRDHENLYKLLESYPASTSYVAKNIANFEGCNSENVVVGNGAIQAIEWVCEGWDIKNLLIPLPTFSTYYEQLPGRHVFASGFWQTDNLTAQNLLRLADSNGADSILLILPNNPTGEAISLVELELLINNLSHKKLIVDESFAHFLDWYDDYKILRNNTKLENVAFIKSMSKDFGVAGLRIGYLTAYDNRLIEYATSKTTWNLNNFAVMFSDLLVAPGFQDRYHVARSTYLDDRDFFYNQLMSVNGLEVMKSQSNFFLMKYPSAICPDLVYELLIDYGIYVRTMEDKIGLDSSYMRVAARRKSENQEFIDVLKSFSWQ